MPKRIEDVFTFLNKFVSSLLIVLIGAMFTMNNNLGSVVSETENLKFLVQKVYAIAEENKSEIAAVKTQSNFIINEQAEMKPIVLQTKDIQTGRTDEIECMNKIMNVLGCDIPKDHPKGIGYE